MPNRPTTPSSISGSRDPRVQAFLTSVADALGVCIVNDRAAEAIGKIYEALETPHPPGDRQARQLPVCDYLSQTLATARAHSEPLARIADSFSALAPLLFWAPALQVDLLQATTGWKVMRTRQSSDPTASRAAMISTLAYHFLAPQVRYPDHRHAPEEVYLVLSPGRFQHGSSSWFEPELGGTLYNEPNIKHAMASGDAPLLAIWCLWTG